MRNGLFDGDKKVPQLRQPNHLFLLFADELVLCGEVAKIFEGALLNNFRDIY